MTHPITRSARSWLWNSLIACAVIAGIASHAHAEEKVTTSRIEALAETYDLQNKAVSATQSRIIFYRPLDSASEGASSIYVNLAVLLPG